MSDIDRMVKLYYDTKEYLEERGCTIYGYFFEGGVENAREIWLGLKPIIEEAMRDFECDITELGFLKKCGVGEEIDNLDKMDWKVLVTIMKNVISRYCDFDGEHLVENGGEIFQLPSTDDKPNTSANIAYLRNKCNDSNMARFKEICLFITSDGKGYYAVGDDHASLAFWLNMNGVDLHNAIHFEGTKNTGEFLITSLYQFAFSKGSNGDRLVKLTYKQCETLNLLYDGIVNMWNKVRPITSTLRASQGFGFGMNDDDKELRAISDIPAINLRRMYMCMPEYFGSSDYQDYGIEMSSKGDLHDYMKGE